MPAGRKFSKILFDEEYINADYVRAGPYCKMRPYKHTGMSDEQFDELMERWAQSMSSKRMQLSFKFYNRDHLDNIREVVSKSDSSENVYKKVKDQKGKSRRVQDGACFYDAERE